MSVPRVDGIINQLWQPLEGRTPHYIYALVDAARNESIYPQIIGSGVKGVCLHRGKMARELAWVAPYLVQLQRDDPFTHWLLDNGWGNSQYIFVRSSARFDELKRHFRTFLTVYDEEGRSYFFRFYDPRVLRVYLPTCNHEELHAIFGSVESFVVEEEDVALLVNFSLLDGKLQREQLAVAG